MNQIPKFPVAGPSDETPTGVADEMSLEQEALAEQMAAFNSPAQETPFAELHQGIVDIRRNLNEIADEIIHESRARELSQLMVKILTQVDRLAECVDQALGD